MLTMHTTVLERYPACRFAWLVVEQVDLPNDRKALDDLKEETIGRLRQMHGEYERAFFVGTEPLCHYASYYKAFGKTYPVLLQLESILLKGKGIPSVGAPVETMFLAEVETLLLTAGHDLDLMREELYMGVARGGEQYTGINGKEQMLTEGDLYLSDGQGILSSILNGPDQRTKITAATKNALYFVYGVDGVTDSQLRSHLEKIASYLTAAIPGASLGTIGLSSGVL